MKNTLKNISIAICLLFCYACTNNEVPVSENAIYFEGNLGKDVITANIEDSDISVPISVRAAKPVDNEVQASVRIDESTVDDYNKKNGTQYTALPADYYTLQDSKYTIEKGKYISNTGILKIKSLTGLPTDKKYVVPVTIVNTTSIPLLQASKSLYVITNRTITTRATSLARNAFKVDFFKNNQGLNAMKTITYETRVLVNRFQVNSPFISSLMGIEENFLLRFGDVTIQPNQLQMAGGNTATTASSAFSTGIWYHVAAVYDGTQIRIYVNGELASSRNAARTVDLTDPTGFYFGFSAGGRYIDGAISEARIWSRALSRNELTNGACGVNPKSEGLIAYWKFNESNDGRTIKDLTGNGRDAIASNNIEWVQGVKCSN
ncbi:DUF1735 domain-containing protein [Elizabethkingia occulta]|uniref:LamG-like jellyroll fold domain-containing protein n=1 Tax=Elizabethkingia occulta TaxID=1867263 RepID=A0A1T3MTI0_9FLAO|nr:DUF1735 and LamG domain-containing protein [Elizabethkingia occulta]OPB91108.1 hypothetical protein BB020_12240 [Elizabethkingia occulta]OPC67942.1 hypothetical protein BAZ10_15225 [Elizabethkingia occulta]